MLRNRRLLLVILPILLVGGMFYGLSYFLSLRTLTINYENIDSVEIYNTKKIDGGKDEKPMKTVSHSGEEVKLRKGEYTLRYDAKDNYQDRFVEINLTDKKQEVNLTAEYSEEYLNKVLDGETASINQAIQERFPEVKDLYSIQKGKLYKDGSWYGTTLVYKAKATGPDLFKTDTLRVVLKKENNRWSVKTDPPNIMLSKYSYPETPVDILRQVNLLPDSSQGE